MFLGKSRTVYYFFWQDVIRNERKEPKRFRGKTTSAFDLLQYFPTGMNPYFLAWNSNLMRNSYDLINQSGVRFVDLEIEFALLGPFLFVQ